MMETTATRVILALTDDHDCTFIIVPNGVSCEDSSVYCFSSDILHRQCCSKACFGLTAPSFVPKSDAKQFLNSTKRLHTGKKGLKDKALKIDS